MVCGHYEDWAIKEEDNYCFIATFDGCNHVQVYLKHAWGPSLAEELRTLKGKDENQNQREFFCDKCLEPRTMRQLNAGLLMDRYKFTPINATRHRQITRTRTSLPSG